MTSDELTAEIIRQWTTQSPRPSMKTIATRLGVTKGVVAGRLNRAGLMTAKVQEEARRDDIVQAIAQTPRTKLAEASPRWETTRPSRTCTWPIGDPRAPNFRYCCRPSRSRSSSYCEEHHAILWSPSPRMLARSA